MPVKSSFSYLKSIYLEIPKREMSQKKYLFQTETIPDFYLNDTFILTISLLLPVLTGGPHVPAPEVT